MSKSFHHHPDGLIQISNGKQFYADKLENFALDYSEPYPGLPPGIKEFRYTEGKAHYFVTNDDVQLAGGLSVTYIEGAITNLTAILTNQQTRLERERNSSELPDADNERRHVNDAKLKEVANKLNIDTTSALWRDDLLVALAQKVFR